MNERQQIHAALKGAKKYLSHIGGPEIVRGTDGEVKTEFICHALQAVGRNSPKQWSGAAAAAEEMIMDRVGHEFYTAHNWLEAQVGEEAVRKAGRGAVQQWRHRWLDQLIKEFSK